MHACGHDGHAAVGIGVLEELLTADFDGTLKVIFQPGEERLVGARSLIDGGVLDDVDYLFGLHLGLGQPTGTIVAGYEGFFAVRQFRARFRGTSAHAAKNPGDGTDAVQSLATAVTSLNGLSRSAEEATRVNVGCVEGGTATNVVPSSAVLAAEVRAETTGTVTALFDDAKRMLESAAAMQDTSVSIEQLGTAPAATSDPALATLVEETAAECAAVEAVAPRATLGGSEDATQMMQRVHDRGGAATYVGVGTDHDAGHHTARFDIDERSLEIGTATLAETIRRVFDTDPLTG
jgi:aminobenzoyl-glutamate utilization protein A